MDLPVTASSAKSFDPELKYMTPSTTRGVISPMPPSASKDHFKVSLPAFEGSISFADEYRLLNRSRLWRGQSLFPARPTRGMEPRWTRSEEHTSELQSQFHLVCRLL